MMLRLICSLLVFSRIILDGLHGEERHFETCDSLDSDDESDGDGLSEMEEDYHAAFKASC